jgi:predicted nucleic acid-binding protein
MPVALLDTNAVSDLMRDHARVKARVATFTGAVLTSVVVRGEIRYGLEWLPPGKKRTDLEARALTILAALPGEPVTAQVSEIYGRTKASGEASGLNMGENDLWIVATALALGAILVTRDHIFMQVPGLLVEDWTA